MDNPILQAMKQSSAPTSQAGSNPILSHMKGDTFQASSTQPINADQTPDDINNAQSYVGNQGYNGYCQTFVEQMTGSGWRGSSAIDAWNRYNQQGQAVEGTRGVKPGDVLYFSPNSSNENYGHTGIYLGGNKFVSATDNGVENYDLNDWRNLTGQDILGYVGGKK